MRGYLYIAAAGLLWGISATLGKVAFNGQLFGPALAALDPRILSQTRTTISFLILAPMLLIARGGSAFIMGRRDVLRCMLLGVFGIAASNFFYYFAIQKTSVSIAIIVQYTAPVWVLLYMALRGHERVTGLRMLAVFGAVVGSALAIGILGRGPVKLVWIGVLASLLAAFSFSFYNIYGRKLLAAHERWIVMTYALLGTAIFWMVLNPPWKIAHAHYSPSQWGFMLLFALTSMLLPFSFYFSGLRHLDPTRAIVTSCLEPVFTVLLAATFLHESFLPLQAVGMALVLTATIIVQLPARNASPSAQGAAR